jgi:hypothetical protein
MGFTVNRIAELRNKLKTKYPKCKSLDFLTQLESDLADIGDDTDADLHERDCADKLDKEEHLKEVVQDTVASMARQRVYRDDQDDRIETKYKTILAAAPSLYRRPVKAMPLSNVKDSKSSNRTPLHKAALDGNLDLVKRLVEHEDANPSIKDNSGQTAGDLALEEDHIEVARYLARAMTMR